jgi:hypothetical protein
MLLSVAVAGIGSPALAASQCGSGGGVKVTTPGLQCSGQGNPIFDMLEFIINWVFRILTAVAVLFIVSSPIFMVASGGNPDMVKKAKSRLINAVIGLILLGLAFVILRQVGVDV